MHIQLIIDYDSESRTLSLQHGDASEGEITPQDAADLMQAAILAMQTPGNIQTALQ